jgi:hypothetical protein
MVNKITTRGMFVYSNRRNTESRNIKVPAGVYRDGRRNSLVCFRAAFP